VHEALQRLGLRDREVLLLAEWEGLSAAEIGVVVGCRTVTARGRLHRARQRFRAAFEALAAEESAGAVHSPQVLAKEGHVHI
jgi:RNA polymerase sigma-70 factor, ECF subfamily